MGIKIENPSTANLSEGAVTETTVDVNSSAGDNATLVEATTVRAGLLSKAKFDEIVANTLKVGVTDGDKGDITVSVSGATWTVGNDAITLAKMVSGTAGNLITYDAAGDPAYVTIGTATQVLTSNGTGAAPTFQDAAAGGIGSFIDTSIAISSDDSALANDDGSANANIGQGLNAGLYITTGTNNIGLGTDGLGGNSTSNLTGSYNIGIGYQTGYNLSTGQYNVLSGHTAGYSMTSGNNNVCTGYKSGYNITEGENNTILGYFAGYGLTTGSRNTVIGYAAGGDTLTNNQVTLIGYNAEPSSTSVANEVTIGDSAITALRCQVTSITALSDRRFKKDITDLGAGLNFVNSLRPVTFNWLDDEMDQEKQSGFIAQEVQESIETHASGELRELILTENPDRLELTQGDLLPSAIKAIQELSAMVRELQAFKDSFGPITESELNSIKNTTTISPM